MKNLGKWVAGCGIIALLCIWGPQPADAFGMSGIGIKAGVNLTREQSYTFYQGVGGQFDSHRWMLGSTLDMGSFLLPKLHFVPGVDFVVQDNLKIYVANADCVYFFHQSPKGRGYAGGGFATHFYRVSGGPNDTKISLNVPLGFQRKLGDGMAWFGEMKLVIADDEKDSALQFSVGFAFGSMD